MASEQPHFVAAFLPTPGLIGGDFNSHGGIARRQIDFHAPRSLHGQQTQQHRRHAINRSKDSRLGLPMEGFDSTERGAQRQHAHREVRENESYVSLVNSRPTSNENRERPCFMR